jgi:hypothetical protein
VLPLKPDQPFTQEFTFSGHQIMYEYGYCKDGGPLNILQLRWILDSPKHDFLEEHDGHSLPLLHEPGDYIFVLKLLHDSNNDPVQGSRWKEVVLLWTLSVSDGGLQKYN